MNKLIHTINSQGTESWRNSKGQLHKENGPAVINSRGDEYWGQNGLPHRTDGPAKIITNGDEDWYENGEIV